MPKITILKKTENDSGWQFVVRLADQDGVAEHLITVPLITYRKLTGGRANPEELVIKSFEFLLEHEPKESILPVFEIDLIASNFPEWEQTMVKQLS